MGEDGWRVVGVEKDVVGTHLNLLSWIFYYRCASALSQYMILIYLYQSNHFQFVSKNLGRRWHWQHIAATPSTMHMIDRWRTGLKSWLSFPEISKQPFMAAWTHPFCSYNQVYWCIRGTAVAGWEKVWGWLFSCFEPPRVWACPRVRAVLMQMWSERSEKKLGGSQNSKHS